LIAYAELFYKRLFYGGWSVGITLIFFEIFFKGFYELAENLFRGDEQEGSASQQASQPASQPASKLT